jgi:hypothetical protein
VNIRIRILLALTVPTTLGLGEINHIVPISPSYLAGFPKFNSSIKQVAPGDIDTLLKDKLTAQGEFVLVQREFELYAWQLFLAISGQQLLGSNISLSAAERSGVPKWQGWLSTAALVSLPKGNPIPPDICVKSTIEAVHPPSELRVLTDISTISTASVRLLRDSSHILDAPVIDQHGNFVFYESLIDPNQVDYICKHNLSSKAGQAELSRSGSGIDFPSGSMDTDWSGSYSIKLAWKILNASQGDDPTRYYAETAKVLDLSESGKPYWHTVFLGLVGMHIVHKTVSAPERIWATFEQADNLAVDRIANPKLKPSFFNPECQLCAENRASNPISARQPTQIARTLPISAETESLNAQVHSVLASTGSVWQYYKLIGVQWPAIPGDATSATPPYLSNAVMETFVQPTPGSTPSTTVSGSHPVERPESKMTGGDPHDVSGQTSCMSCHARAPIAGGSHRQAGDLSKSNGGDFSWFLSERVH